MKQTVIVACAHCNNPVTKPKKEFNRRMKAGKDVFYCNLRCAAHGNLIHKRCPYVPGTPVGIPGNRRDEFTVIRRHLTRAKARARDCNLTLHYLKDLWNRQNGKCAYTNLPLTSCGMTATSLDRIDSSKGYVEENVQFICRSLNLAKSSYSDTEMRNFLTSIRQV